MKKKILYSLFTAILLQALVCPIVSKAGERIAERLYIATDRGAYVSGEAIWLSVYCMDISGEDISLSELSSVAYVEIHNSAGLALTCKIALKNGRGSGRLELPPSLPTGNYRMIGYTKQMLNEEPVTYFDKVISIYNTLSAERVPGNVLTERDSSNNFISGAGFVMAVDAPEREIVSVNLDNNTKVSKNSRLPIALTNNGEESVTLNISVVRVDSIPSPSSINICSALSDYRKNAGISKFTNKHTPEYEGEIIRGKVSYKGDDIITEKLVFLSAVNGLSDVYSSPVDKMGNISFFTNSIFGDRDIVLEIPKTDTNCTMTFELYDPFAKPEIKTLPKLFLSSRIAQSLNDRSIEMQLGRRFGSDTLFERVSLRNDPLMRIKPIVYKLDDYTRFPYMQEIVVEYISELRFRKIDDKVDLQMRWEDGFNTLTYSKDNTLVLIDGIPVFDHKRVMDYDPLKVKSLSVYGKEYFIGMASFSGIVSMQTYKGNFPGLTFNKNVRIMDYKGVLYPCRLTAKENAECVNVPDLRSTLYFDPQVDISNKGSREITIYTSSYPGQYKITVEGMDKKGNPIYISALFEVK